MARFGRVTVVAVVAASLAGLGAGVAAGLLPGGDETVRQATAPVTRASSSVVPSPAVPVPSAGTPDGGTPSASPPGGASPGPAAGAPLSTPPPPGCPGRPQVLAAAAAEEPGARGAPTVITGPECAAGWAAAIIGVPADGTRRLVLRREGGVFATVVYQPTLDPCPATLARMPAKLRASVAC